jgi:hypothetical protein
LVWRLTAPLQLRPVRGHRRVGRHRSMAAPPCRGVFDRVQSSRHGPLTPPVATQSPGDESRRPPRYRGPPSPALVNEHGFGRPGTPSIDKCLHVPCDACWPATGPAVLPLRSGFRRSFAPRLLCTGGARLGVTPSTLRAGTTTGHTPPVDFCHRYVLRARPRTVRTPQDLSDGSPSEQPVLRSVGVSADATDCGWRRPFRSAASRDVAGQGSRDAAFAVLSTLATAIARGGNFAPTRSARTPLVAARAGAWVGEPRAHSEPS